MEDKQTLAERAVAGDRQSLEELLRAYGPVVKASLEVSPSWQAAVSADDVMQVSYLEAFLTVSNFRPTGPNSFRNWLQRIAQNNLRDAIKELKRDKRPDARRRVTPGGEDSVVGLLELLGVTTTTPSIHARRHEAAQSLQRALRSLPADYAAAVRLYDLEGRSIGEVAAAMNRTPGAIHMLRARAHERLRELLGPASQILSG